jgi:hypothetical protein
MKNNDGMHDQHLQVVDQVVQFQFLKHLRNLEAHQVVKQNLKLI